MGHTPRNDNLWYHQCQQGCHYDDFHFSVLLTRNLTFRTRRSSSGKLMMARSIWSSHPRESTIHPGQVCSPFLWTVAISFFREIHGPSESLLDCELSSALEPINLWWFCLNLQFKLWLSFRALTLDSSSSAHNKQSCCLHFSSKSIFFKILSLSWIEDFLPCRRSVEQDCTMAIPVILMVVSHSKW